MSHNSSLALYIHWPFCKAKCPYCDFNSHVRESVDQAAWREALLAELRWYAESRIGNLESRKRLSSIFFGGGTPSLMPPSTVAAIISEAERIFGLEEGVEITLEANPTSVEAGRFREYAAGGVNRLSLGIQSLEDRHLHFLGREHSAKEARAAIELAARTFQRFSFDLIYSLYGQSLNDWQNELMAALQIAGNHLSLYQLTIEESTKFYHLHQAGKLPTLSADEAAGYYELTQQIMESAGMPAYEISNHARPGEESRHNLTYWRGGEYIGIGPGAHGRVVCAGVTEQGEARSGRGSEAGGVSPPSKTRHATTNFRSPEKWLAQVQDKGHGIESSIALSPEEIREEKLLMGIRLREGIACEGFDWSAKTLEALVQEGLITLTPSHLIPTAKGRLVLNSLIEVLSSDSCR